MTVKFEVVYSGIVTVATDGGSCADADAVIEDAFDNTMRELVKLNVEDPSVSGAIASGEIELSAVFDELSPTAAMDQADATFRSALHAAGVFTEGWEATGPLRVAWHRIEADDTAFETVS